MNAKTVLALLCLCSMATALGVVPDWYQDDIIFLKPGEQRIYNIQLQNTGPTEERIELIIRTPDNSSLTPGDDSYPFYTVPAAKSQNEPGRRDLKFTFTAPKDAPQGTGFSYEFFFKSTIPKTVNVPGKDGNTVPVKFLPAVGFTLSIIVGENITTGSTLPKSPCDDITCALPPTEQVPTISKLMFWGALFFCVIVLFIMKHLVMRLKKPRKPELEPMKTEYPKESPVY